MEFERERLVVAGKSEQLGKHLAMDPARGSRIGSSRGTLVVDSHHFQFVRPAIDNWCASRWREGGRMACVSGAPWIPIPAVTSQHTAPNTTTKPASESKNWDRPGSSVAPIGYLLAEPYRDVSLAFTSWQGGVAASHGASAADSAAWQAASRKDPEIKRSPRRLDASPVQLKGPASR